MFGRLEENGSEICKTIELPWRNNQSNISCIPTGTYKCKWTWSPAFKRSMYILENVPQRSGIRIHKGSYAGAVDKGFRTDFLGCISFGRGIVYDSVNEQHILHTTAVTVAHFEEDVNHKDFTLTIRGEFDPI